MKVVAVVPMYPPHSLVGAWISTHACLQHLAQRGHQVDVVTMMSRRHLHTHEGVTIHPKGDLRAVVAGADLIVSHLGDQGHGAMWADRLGVPSVRMVHGRVDGPLDRLDQFAGTQLAVFNSRASQVEVDWDGPSIVVHPPIVPDDYVTTPGTAVTLINLCPAKGGRLFWDLVERMPGTEFLGVVGGYGRPALPAAAQAALVLGIEDVGPNVRVIPNQPDPRDVYARTRVLLVPSEHESYGRVAVEAMCSGIPVIAHPTPGLREACGEAAWFIDRDDTDAWVNAVATLADPVSWARRSQRALEHTAHLDPTPGLDLFADSIEALLPVGVAA